ncbi:hypothetical protein MNBD_IGNAVI01-40 [hydrothermal vent metagenome]|uniref:Uncharacterized protein n=1 Tax=hydrothermal vent metagenome TaxID=652676 RepID=A0A3B1CQU4_9ZZZZ
MKLKKSINLILVLFVFYFLTQNTFGQERNVLENLANRADIIIIGTVKEINYKWNEDKTSIWTFVRIDIEENIKGVKIQNGITIRVLGGEIGNIGMKVSNSPLFEVNRRYLCFLQKDSNETFAVSDWEAGKFVSKNGTWQNKMSVISNSQITAFKKNIQK